MNAKREEMHFEKLYKSQKSNKYLLQLGVKEDENYSNKANTVKYFLSNINKPLVLELGVGRGNLTKHIHTYAHTYIGIDINMTGLLYVNELFPQITFMKMDAQKTAFKSGSFDAIIGSGVLHHVNMQTVLSEIERILKPGGVIIFFEPNLYFVENYLINKIPFFRKLSTLSNDECHFTKDGIQEDIKKYKIKQLKVEYYFSYHPKLPKFMRPVNIFLNKLFKKAHFQIASRELVITGQRE